MFVHFVVV